MMDSCASLCGPDSLSMQEMLDLEIKSEKDLDDLFRDSNLDFQELPAINLDEDSLGAPGENNVWRTSSSEKSWLLGSDINLGISADFSSDETRMVSPYSVMPVTLIQVHEKNSLRSENNFKPLTIKTNRGIRTITPESVGIFQETIKEQTPDVNVKVESVMVDDGDFEETGPRTILVKNNNQVTRSKARSQEPAMQAVSNSTKRSISVKSTNPKRRLQDFAIDNDLNLTISAYPKPAYSYSCLIAMALKNSPSGCLPVSEIYNFMCEHFPYFKTAPTGWKNSVRHNLSLNKCFEKIEKPATNGSQRKGCLWAMNPTKINKMDEEVQKWSKKDKTAIRKSMICPESLDALERGALSVCQMPGASDAESDEESWDRRPWVVKQEDEDDDDDEEDEDDVDEIDPKTWARGLSATKTSSCEEYDSDISLSDFDLDADAMFGNAQTTPNKVNVRVKVATSPSGAFQPLLSGAYTVNSQGTTDTSPKRLKTLSGSTITGNYVYKPFGTSSLRRKSPVRHSLLSSLEADD